MNRDKKIDITKGIGIVLMVLCHAGFKYSSFVYLFHMPLFIIVAGYCYKEDYSSSSIKVWDLFVKRLKSLWLPYAIFNSMFVLLNNTFIKLNIYTNNQEFLNTPQGKFSNIHLMMSRREIFNVVMDCISFDYIPQIAGAAWFVKTLFSVTMLYCCINYIVLKISRGNRYFTNLIQIVIAILMLGLGYYCKTYGKALRHGMELVFTVYFMFELGYILSQDTSKYYLKYKLPVAIGAGFILYKCNAIGHVDLVMCDYTSPSFLFITSLMGWLLIYCISDFIVDVKYLDKIFGYLGKNTLSILFLHFLAFKLVNYLQVIIYKEPLYMVAAFPSLHTDGMWFAIYTLVGILIPCVLVEIYRRIKNILEI